MKPAILDQREQLAGSIGAWTRDLSFDNDAIAQLGLKIELPGPGEIRARKLISRSRRVMTGKYPSWKIGRLVHWESRVESKVFRMLDACPGVARFAEQPFTIYFLVDGRWYAHIPDVAFLTYDGVLWILEIKSIRDPNIADAIRRAAVIAPRLKCLGFNYTIAKELDVRAGTSLLNAETLVRFGRLTSSAISDQAIQQLLEERSSLSRNDLVGRVIDRQHAFHAAANLVLRGDVSINWSDANRQLLRVQKRHDHNAEESLSWLQRALGVIK